LYHQASSKASVDIYYKCLCMFGNNQCRLVFDLKDTTNTTATFDYPIVNRVDSTKPISVVMAVNVSSIVTYLNGAIIPEIAYKFEYDVLAANANIARPHPGTLSKNFAPTFFQDLCYNNPSVLSYPHSTPLWNVSDLLVYNKFLALPDIAPCVIAKNGSGISSRPVSHVCASGTYSVTVNVQTQAKGSEISWGVDSFMKYGPYADNQRYVAYMCLLPGPHKLAYFDSAGDGWNGGSWELVMTLTQQKFGNGTVTGSGGESMFTVNSNYTGTMAASSVVSIVIQTGSAFADEISWKLDSGTLFPGAKNPYKGGGKYEYNVTVSQGDHTFYSEDAFNDGWGNDAYWQINDASGKTIAGGPTNGKVVGAGGETKFCVGAGCAPVSSTRAPSATPTATPTSPTKSPTSAPTSSGQTLAPSASPTTTSPTAPTTSPSINSSASVNPAGGQVPIVVTITTKAWADEITWNLDSGAVFGANPKYTDNKANMTVMSVPAGNHTIKYFDSFSDGWDGGFWEVFDNSTGHLVHVAGGNVSGAVKSSGGETKFCVGGVSVCGVSGVASGPQAVIVVTIHTKKFADEVTWNIDGGSAFGPYADDIHKRETLSLSLGQHTLYYMDKFSDGWGGGWWEVTDSCNRRLAGGESAGAVTGAGGTSQFNINATSAACTAATPPPPPAVCTEVPIVVHISTRKWADEISWDIDGGTKFGKSPGYADNKEVYARFCMTEGAHTFHAFDTFADGWDGAYFEVLDQNGTHVIAGGKTAGKVTGSGATVGFTLSKSGAAQSSSKMHNVSVTIVAQGFADEISWSIDGGTKYDKYKDNSNKTTVISLSEGQHTLAYFDSFADGWQGGYWQLNVDNQTLGGPKDGQVMNSGGSKKFCVGTCNAAAVDSNSNVTVHIHTLTHAAEVSWSLDRGQSFGPYADSSDKYEHITITNGNHTLNLAASGQGWHGGYWEVLNSAGSRIAGGPTAGLVSGNGGSAQLCVGVGCPSSGSASNSSGVPIEVKIFNKDWADENTWQLDNLKKFGPYTDNTNITEAFTLPAGSHTMKYFDDFSDGWNGGYWEVHYACPGGAHNMIANATVTNAGGEKTFMVAACA